MPKLDPICAPDFNIRTRSEKTSEVKLKTFVPNIHLSAQKHLQREANVCHPGTRTCSEPQEQRGRRRFTGVLCGKHSHLNSLSLQLRLYATNLSLCDTHRDYIAMVMWASSVFPQRAPEKDAVKWQVIVGARGRHLNIHLVKSDPQSSKAMFL